MKSLRHNRTVSSRTLNASAIRPLEHEADGVANQVMRMSAPELSIAAAPPQISWKCAACEEEEAKTPQTKPAGIPVSAAARAPGIVHEVLGSPGQRLDAPTRAFFEPRFGHDFSRMRVHADARAAASAAGVSARAYTVGENIVFGARQYAPETPAGQRLLAHELAHVLQQGEDAGTLRRAPCRTAAQCKAPQKGDPGEFSKKADSADAAGSAALSAAAPGTKQAALKARMGERATHTENLLKANGIPLRPEVPGISVNPEIDPTVSGAATPRCKDFPGGSPGHPLLPATNSAFRFRRRRRTLQKDWTSPRRFPSHKK